MSSSREARCSLEYGDLLSPQHPILADEVDSPTDPLFQQGRLSPIPPSGRHRTAPSIASLNSAVKPFSDDSQDSQSQRAPMLSKTIVGNKGSCRGCSKIIEANQKSVSSVDGRLTGRYHKQCFVCHNCRHAFATADFYVFRDLPYCAQHYHALNGSLCGSCGQGIEGQYLETTRSKFKGPEKFHTQCFTCAMCRIALQADYFEFNGKFYCERDAYSAAASASNRARNNPRTGSPLRPRENAFPSNRGAGPAGKFPERRS